MGAACPCCSSPRPCCLRADTEQMGWEWGTWLQQLALPAPSSQRSGSEKPGWSEWQKPSLLSAPPEGLSAPAGCMGRPVSRPPMPGSSGGLQA